MKQFYKTVTALSAIWTLSFLGLLYISLFHPILKENSPKYLKYRSPKKQTNSLPPLQQRFGVSKEIWISSLGKRVHCHIESPTSKIQSLSNGNGLTIQETLDNLKVWIRDDSLNEIKYFRSKTATLDLAKQTLFSELAFLSTYKMTDTEKAVFSCDFKDVTLSFKESPLVFSANGFSAHLSTEGSL